MKLTHYAAAPVSGIRAIPQGKDTFKPRGFWVTDDDCEDNWRNWCVSESFALERLTHIHDVVLSPGANVLVLQSAAEIDDFTAEYVDGTSRHYRDIRWREVRRKYSGLIVTPYIWARRLHDGTGWYYSWDCASGCIWDPKAIAGVTLREVVPVPVCLQHVDTAA